MIYLSEAQLSQVDYLIQQSIQGHHPLFDPEVIRRTFGGRWKFREISDEDAYAAEPLLERLMNFTSLQEKRAYLEGLENSELEKVILTYFNIVENNLYESIETRH